MCGAAGWIALSWIQPRFRPRAAGRVALEHDAIMQPERPVVPELDLRRHDAIARPVWRSRHGANGVFRGVERDRFLEGEAALQALRLLARPGADLGLLRPRREISIGVGVADALDGSTHADLPVDRFPMEHQRRLRARVQLLPLLAFNVRIAVSYTHLRAHE